YGFVYLPGSGLKGMARAYAETLWLSTQTDRHAAWRTIEDVFGWAPNRDRQKQIRAADHPATRRPLYDAAPLTPEITAHTGAIVFHDAWPETWPRPVLDIVNNHHQVLRDAPGFSHGEVSRCLRSRQSIWCSPQGWDTPGFSHGEEVTVSATRTPSTLQATG